MKTFDQMWDEYWGKYIDRRASPVQVDGTKHAFILGMWAMANFMTELDRAHSVDPTQENELRELYRKCLNDSTTALRRLNESAAANLSADTLSPEPTEKEHGDRRSE
jgi:hypothetical protein